MRLSTHYKGGVCEKPQYKKAKYTYATQGIVYNQSEFEDSKNACSIYASMTAISNNYNILYSKEDRKEIIQEAKKEGYDPSWGWYMSSAVSFVAKWTRKNKGLNIIDVRVNWTQTRKLNALGWGVVSGMKIRKGFWQDKLDGIVGNEKINYGETRAGHLVSFWNTPHLHLLSRNIYLDNYGDSYKYKETRISKYRNLVKKDVMFDSGYVFQEL